MSDSTTVFSFGRNWQRFLDESFSEERAAVAAASVRSILGREELEGLRFLDVGSGSGLFSLAAHRLGARVVSFDVDEHSVAATRSLRAREGDPASWEVLHGSVLDSAFMEGLGVFDVVYSWGVLHHTGRMWDAIAAAGGRVAPGGTFAIGIYNWIGGRRGTETWVRLKRWYCTAPRWQTRLWEGAYAAARLARLTVVGRNPVRYLREYQRNRGMSWFRDATDWLGGYPYEAATPGEILAFVRERLGFQLERQRIVEGHGVSEYTFFAAAERGAGVEERSGAAAGAAGR